MGDCFICRANSRIRLPPKKEKKTFFFQQMTKNTFNSIRVVNQTYKKRLFKLSVNIKNRAANKNAIPHQRDSREIKSNDWDHKKRTAKKNREEDRRIDELRLVRSNNVPDIPV